MAEKERFELSLGYKPTTPLAVMDKKSNSLNSHK